MHGKLIFTYGANRFFCFFVLQGSLGRTKPSRCISVFSSKFKSNGIFRWLTEALSFMLVRLAHLLSKVIFELHFLHFSVFAICPTRNAQFSKCGPALFWLILQLCVSLQTYSIKMKHWNCQFSPPDFGKTISLTWIAKNQHGVNNFDAFSYFRKTVFLLPT